MRLLQLGTTEKPLATEGPEPCHIKVALIADVTIFFNLTPMVPNFHACSPLQVGLVLRVLRLA